MKIILVAALLSLSVAPAFAEYGPLTPAPTPALDAGRVTPADRAGRSNSSDNGAPFSGTPDNLIAGTGQPTPSTIGTPDDRTTAPSPSVSK